MSEAILKALMQLFALISDIHDDTVITSRERSIVKLFLIRHLNNELVDKYMSMFEEFLGIFNSERIIKGSIQDRKRISLNAMRILGICEKINSELMQKQKVYVFVKLTDYISSGTEITETELDFLETVASAFNIPDNEFKNIRNFILMNDPEACEKTEVLIIDNGESNGVEGIKRICKEHLKGRVGLLSVRSTGTYLMRYTGDEVLYLNGQNIQEGETYILDSGSAIRGSGIKAIYHSEIVGTMLPLSQKGSICLEARDVTYTFRNSDNGIHNLYFTGRSGELVGVIGGSGVGKSTTLSILSGSLKPGQGKIFLNGYDLYNEDDHQKLRGVIGFVPQDDLLMEDLTVFRNLYYNARMCLSNLSEEQIVAAVNRILIDLDLDETRDLKVGNPMNKIISGGQRKRLNIALELIREPAVLFVDEPTSGLSSVDSEMVMNLLKDLTYKGKLVIVNIHQPSSEIYKMFDKIMIIDRGGYQVYFGNPNAAINYFKVQTNHANPDEDQCPKCGNIDTEQILQIIEARVVDEKGKTTRTRKVSPAEWARRFRAYNTIPGKLVKEIQPLPPNSYSTPGKLMQTVVFFSRDMLSKLADKQYLIISLLGPPLLAVFLAFFTKTPEENYTFNENENIPAFMFMCVITSMFFGLMGSCEEIVKDRKILKRESFLNLSWFSYLNSKVAIMFILSAVQSISFVIAGNLILEIRGMTLSFWMVMFTTSCFANVLGLTLSSAFKSVVAIYILIPFIIIPQLLFSGVLVKYDKLHTMRSSREFVPLTGNLMIGRWAFEAMAVNQFSNNKYEREFFRYNTDIATNDWYAGWLVQNLKNKIRFNIKYKDSTGYGYVKLNNLKKLNKYVPEVAEMTGFAIKPELLEMLMQEQLDSARGTELYNNLESMRNIFVHRRKIADSLKNARVREIKMEIGTEALVDLKNKHTNEKLIEYLRTPGKEQIGETDEVIYQKYQPVYMIARSPGGKAHFYAPFKTMGKTQVDTFTFNMVVIWLVTFFLYLVLWLKAPGKIFTFFENIRLKKGD